MLRRPATTLTLSKEEVSKFITESKLNPHKRQKGEITDNTNIMDNNISKNQGTETIQDDNLNILAATLGLNPPNTTVNYRRETIDNSLNSTSLPEGRSETEQRPSLQITNDENPFYQPQRG